MFDVTYAQGAPQLFTTDLENPLVKRICGMEYDLEMGVYKAPWFWPLCQPVAADIETLFGMETVSASAMTELMAQRDIVRQYKERKFPVTLPDDFFHFQPYQHQLDGLVLASLTWRVGWLYQMGLGKSKMAVDAIRIQRLKYPAQRLRFLIVTPSPVIDGFRREIDLHSKGELSHAAYHKESRLTALEEDPDIVLTTYGTARLHPERLATHGFFGIVCDESHRFRNWDTVTAPAMLSIRQNIPWRVIMTGSPGSDPRHWFTPFRFMSSALTPEGTYTNFKQRYLKYSRQQRFVVDGYKNMQYLRDRARTVFLSRKVADCLDLPAKTVVDVSVQLAPETQKVYNELVANGEAQIGGRTVALPYDATIVQIQALQQVSRGWMNESQKDPELCDACPHLRTCISRKISPYTPDCKVVTKAPSPITHTITAQPRVTARAVDMLCDILDANSQSKVLVWFRSNETMRRCIAMFERQRGQSDGTDRKNNPMEALYPKDDVKQLDMHKIERVGEEHIVFSSGANYNELVEKFQNDPKIRVCFGQIKCAIGVTMTAAQYTFYPDMTMNPDDYLQSEARNYRPGQDMPVFVYRFNAEGTLDAGIQKLIDQKESVEEALRGGDFCAKCAEKGYCTLGLKKAAEFGKRDSEQAPCALNKLVRRSKLRVSAVPEATEAQVAFQESMSDPDNPFELTLESMQKNRL